MDCKCGAKATLDNKCVRCYIRHREDEKNRGMGKDKPMGKGDAPKCAICGNEKDAVKGGWNDTKVRHRRCKPKKASPSPGPGNPPAPSPKGKGGKTASTLNGKKDLVLDFTGHEALCEDLRRLAKENYREIEGQILFMLNEACEAAK